jgi:ferritin
MFSKTVLDAMNDHLNNEFYSSYLYLAMEAYCESINLPGAAHWMRIQAEEENAHAMKFYSHIHDRGGRVVLQAIAQPPVDFASMLEVFQQALDHEREVTARIHQLYSLPHQEQDYPTQTFLQWFVNEQVEEERTATQIVETLKMIGDNNVALLMLDRELAARQPEPTPAT